MFKNSILDAPKHVQARFLVIQKQAERDAKKRGDTHLLWPMKKNSKGYGEFHWVDPLTRQRYGTAAHLASLELHLGRKLEPTEYACHRCSIHGAHEEHKACFNPKHLEADTMSENILDNYYGTGRNRD